MSLQIDWESDAPTNAVAALVTKECNAFHPRVVFASVAGKNGHMLLGLAAHDGRPLAGLGDSWDLVLRPVAAWTGEGLPPVGTVCEFAGGEGDPKDPWHTSLKDGAKVTVIAHYDNMGETVAVFTFVDQRDAVCGMQVEQAMAQCFRPIRTPEQIAADEREAACEAMLEIAKSRRPDPDLCEAIGALYDAGLRMPASDPKA